ncbi:recombinase family protein [Novosphingobium sp. G106]|uniref:recombinase family protein n=1 Tax=Novosphingobium sp. G106 TaxID=2849500 RepID=UPI001C2CCC72|nr:recombinase family protein [Novosphingobium sp. G106]MBV1692678.1 recombinase family protein [Novosphingobium sp. G106]
MRADRDQNLDLQLSPLEAAEGDPIITDKITGVKTSRVEIDQALKLVEPGAELAVWKLDRFGRPMLSGMNTVIDMHK